MEVVHGWYYFLSYHTLCVIKKHLKSIEKIKFHDFCRSLIIIIEKLSLVPLCNSNITFFWRSINFYLYRKRSQYEIISSNSDTLLKNNTREFLFELTDSIFIHRCCTNCYWSQWREIVIINHWMIHEEHCDWWYDRNSLDLKKKKIKKMKVHNWLTGP